MRSELKLKTIRSFDNDVKRLKKKHYDISRLEEPLRALGESDTDVLKTKYSDHALTGDSANCMSNQTYYLYIAATETRFL